ncbi:nuclear transport factor 2 family protein [Pseudarthrobacter sp. AL07]|uniref:nuclear transport factor 2 family protein n=1 Tax=unclassified Pseudarthrobacter TaxID=2647000 RepID=UPI00249C8AD3|nr:MULTISPECIES: nuclear transport factor 2 family protein [unclassified Pseudarthrobacter]MDI3195665.1 nuclear transport factor 2 family protein [Pseudarthrobacter sp. AL20]MDI3209786.1 nuclear transport factor 2 family protein [Pseudarthrobacter sp. AL07]
MDASGIERVPEGPVRRMLDAANRHDLEAMVAEFAKDYRNATPVHPARSFTGSAQVRKNWTALFAGMPDLTLTVHDVATRPGGKVWLEWSNCGTRPDGSVQRAAGVSILTVRDDKIAAAQFYLEPVDDGPGDVNEAISSAVGGATGGDRP